MTTLDETADCAVTGESVDLSDSYYFVTVRRDSPYRWGKTAYEHLIVKDDRALDNLENEINS